MGLLARSRLCRLLIVAVGLLMGCEASTPVLFEALGGTGGALPTLDGGLPSGPDGGLVDPDPDLDPDVVFEWVQTAPGGSCEDGSYVGTFRCQNGSGLVFTGVTTFALFSGTAETELKLSDGRLDLVDPALAPEGEGTVVLQAGLTGTLDCVDDGFRAEALPQQSLFAPLPLGFFAPIVATISGARAVSTQALSGTITIEGGLARCEGPWTARRAP